MRYWPGGDARAALNPAEALAQKVESETRSAKVHEFPHSEIFRQSSVICVVSSFPRWYMARCLFSETKDGPLAGSAGISKALRVMVATTDSIVKGKTISSKN